MDLVIGLDSGTTATKAVAVAADATVITTSSVGYPLLVPEPGYAELDPVRLQAAAVQAVAEVATQVRQRGDRVVGLCLSAAMHGLAPLDGAGSPTGPLITWADSRAGEESRSIALGSRGELHKRTGTPVHPMSPLPKLLWWRLHHPDAFASTPKWGGVKEVVLSGLCQDAYLIDLSCASTTGLYDITRRQWDPEALQLAGIDVENLATVVPTTYVVTGLRSEVAEQTGLPRDLPVVVGASDGPLANLGLGAVREGIAAVSLGTSGALRAVRSAPAVDQAARLFCYALTDDHWVLGGAINNAGSVVRWASAALGMVTEDVQGEERDAADGRLLQEAANVPFGSEGLLCLPYLLGERAPWWAPGLQGAWIGIRRHHRRGHLVRSAVEGVCMQLALVALALEAAGVHVREVRATGGAMGSPVWREVLSAALDLPVGLAASPEGAGTGAGLLGHYALGSLPYLDRAADLIAVDRGEPPHPDDVAALRRLLPLLERCTVELKPVFAELASAKPRASADEPADRR
jgi:gluconokinase